MARKTNLIKFNYQKTNEYRNHHVDGAYGGLTPKGYISMLFFSERHVLPKIVEKEIDSAGKTINEKIIEAKEGIIREVETGITFDLGTAISLKDWLTKQIDLHPQNKIDQ